MDPDSMKMEDKKGEMMQSQNMTADEMIKKGHEMIMHGKEMKKKEMKEDEMMNDKGMKQGETDKDKMKMNK
ncbi:MAG: hypothetical protein ACHQYP_08065 [Nitrospiria bacterium]